MLPKSVANDNRRDNATISCIIKIIETTTARTSYETSMEYE